MVLYNSPTAVALLIATLLGVTAGVAVTQLRLYRAAAALPTPSAARAVQREVVRASILVGAIFLFWLFLVFATNERAYNSHSSITYPTTEVRWSPRNAPPAPTFDFTPKVDRRTRLRE